MAKNHIEDQSFEAATRLEKAEYENCRFLNCALFEADLSGFVFVDCAFENCDLSMATIRNAAFRTVRFSNCKMLGLRFEDCNPFALAFSFENCALDFASFFRLKIAGTVFRNCKMQSVELIEADLARAVFDQTDLLGATFEGTKLDGADLRTALNFAIDPEANSLKKARFVAQNLAGLLGKHRLVIE